MDWVADKIRAEQEGRIVERERLLVSIQLQVERLKRMEDQLYEDKLAGDISIEKYTAKHEQFKAQREELEARKEKIEQTAAKSLEQRLVILELSQKAANIYMHKSPEQKRLIITKLFKSITAYNGEISVTYTNFSRAIAERVLKTNQLIRR